MSRLVLCAALCCASPEPTSATPRALALELAATEERLASVEQLLQVTRMEVDELGTALDDARILILLGGPPRRWHGAGVTCDGGQYLPGSLGAAAHRALRETGYCDPTELPSQLAAVKTVKR